MIYGKGSTLNVLLFKKKIKGQRDISFSLSNLKIHILSQTTLLKPV